MPTEAQTVIVGTVRKNVEITRFRETEVWNLIEAFTQIPASGGASYDAFIIEVLAAAGADRIATRNTAEFTRLSRSVPVFDPLKTPA